MPFESKMIELQIESTKNVIKYTVMQNITKYPYKVNIARINVIEYMMLFDKYKVIMLDAKK